MTNSPQPQDSQAIILDLERQLRAGFEHGDRFWSARQLAERYQISSSLAQKVTSLLVGKGLLRTEARSGTFVVKQQQADRLRFLFVYGGWSSAMGNSLHFQVFHGAAAAAALEDCDLHYLPLSADTPDLAARIAEQAADGAILSSRLDAEVVDAFRESGIPLVAYRDPRHHMHAVLPDYETGAFQVVEHLVELGHRRIACLRAKSHYYESWRLGYEAALRKAKLPIDPELYWDLERADRELRRLAHGKRRSDDPTAAFLPNDSTAIALIRESGIRVPDQLSIAGFEDRDPEGLMDPPLTTVKIHPPRLGETAIRLLLLVRNRLDQRPMIRVLPTELAVRRSTAPVTQQDPSMTITTIP